MIISKVSIGDEALLELPVKGTIWALIEDVDDDNDTISISDQDGTKYEIPFDLILQWQVVAEAY
tara:strand:- start:613 stop:804 length:192 start_codon:yes stop_codon:yes gene_type:complete